MIQNIPVAGGRKVRKEWLEQAWLAICDLQPLTDREKQALFLDLRAAEETNGGWEVQTAMVAMAYEKHLQERSWWHWGEYEYWRNLYYSSGLRPTGFTPKPDPYALQPEDDIYQYTTLQQMKSVLASVGLEPPRKAITKGVAEMIRGDTKLFMEAKRHICLKAKWREFELFMFTIGRRESSQMLLAMSDREHPLQLVNYEPRLESAFMDAALKYCPKRLAPYWPQAPHHWISTWERYGDLEGVGIEIR